MEKNVAIGLLERKDRALEHVGLDGKTRTYLPAKSIWLSLKQLRVAQQLAEPVTADAQPTLSTSLHGVGDLNDQALSIIGDTRCATHAVEVSFWARDVGKADRLGLRELEDELGLSFSDLALGTARLGVNRGNAETGESEHWWLACHIPQACIDALSMASSDGQLEAVEVGLMLRHLYTAATPEASPLPEPNLFLRPNMSDSTIDWPEIAVGYVTHLRIDRAARRLRDAESSVGRGDEPMASPVAEAVNSLSFRLAGLVTTVRWVCVFVALLVFLEILEKI